MGCRLVFFAAFIATAAALPTIERVKRADETVMFGNQQNLAHKSVKKSGPAPLDSKMAAKQEAVAEAAAEDPEQELPQGVLTAADEDRLEDELRTLMQEQREAEKEKKAVKKAEKKAEKKAVKKAVKKAERPTVELDLAHAEKKASEQHEKQPEKTRKDYEADMHYLSYLINKMNPEDAFPGVSEQQLSRPRRAVPFRRIRRSLSKMAAESHMAVSAQHRKKRDADIDPRQLAMLEYALAQANDGYDEPEEVEEPVYDRPLGDEPALTPAGLARERLEDAELARLEEEEQPEPEGPPPEAERDYSMMKRIPDLESDMEGPPQLPQLPPELQAAEPQEEEEAEEAPEPVSVYDSEYGPLVYSMVEHNGVRGLFVPLDQPSMAQLAAAEAEDRQREKQRLNLLGALLSLNQKKK